MAIQQNQSLQSYNTFGLEVKAQHLLEIKTIADYDPAFLRNYESVFILGGGSNVLLLQDVAGLVLRMNVLGKEVIEETDEKVVLKIGAGENWHGLVLWSLEQGWSGLENLSLIPGTVGAAPIQNIGAYGVELADVLEKVEGVFLADASPFSLNKDQCRLGYRQSIFKNEWKGKALISQVYLTLSKTYAPNISYGAIQTVLDQKEIENPTAKDVSEAVISIRQSKLPDPKELGNAGSFFKNPIIPQEHFEKLQKEFPDMPSYPAGEGFRKVPAGWLIEQAGWKGKKIGATGSHAKQALVLVNYGGASGKEIYNLSEAILKSVQENFKIRLEREVTMVGNPDLFAK